VGVSNLSLAIYIYMNDIVLTRLKVLISCRTPTRQLIESVCGPLYSWWISWSLWILDAKRRRLRDIFVSMVDGGPPVDNVMHRRYMLEGFSLVDLYI
jgi:hypothetical protein